MNSTTRKLIQSTVLQHMDTLLSFTSLDVRNDLRTISDAVRYQDVADTVRDMFESYVIEDRGYTRCLVEVETDGGEIVQSFLYLHKSQYEEHLASCRQSEGTPKRPQAGKPVYRSTEDAIQVSTPKKSRRKQAA